MLGLVACLTNPQHESNQLALTTTDPASEVARLISTDLGFPVSVNVVNYRNSDDWIFMSGNPTDEAGGRIDYTETHYASDWREGFFDDVFMALFRIDNNSGSEKIYDLIEFSLGATDAPFLDWKIKHALPNELFQSEK